MKKPKSKDIECLVYLNKSNQLIIVKFEKNTIKVSFSRDHAMIGCNDGVMDVLATLYGWGAVQIGVL